MSLKNFHIVFIILSILVSFGLGGWAVRHASSYMGLGVIALGLGSVLIVYGAVYFKKLKRIG